MTRHQNSNSLMITKSIQGLNLDQNQFCRQYSRRSIVTMAVILVTRRSRDTAAEGLFKDAPNLRVSVRYKEIGRPLIPRI